MENWYISDDIEAGSPVLLDRMQRTIVLHGMVSMMFHMLLQDLAGLAPGLFASRGTPIASRLETLPASAKDTSLAALAGRFDALSARLALCDDPGNWRYNALTQSIAVTCRNAQGAELRTESWFCADFDRWIVELEDLSIEISARLPRSLPKLNIAALADIRA
ncbi:MAG: hypothetical protein RLZZ444_1707 [Pseudomonadota bacterium]